MSAYRTFRKFYISVKHDAMYSWCDDVVPIFISDPDIKKTNRAPLKIFHHQVRGCDTFQRPQDSKPAA